MPSKPRLVERKYNYTTLAAYWSHPTSELLKTLRSTPTGLTAPDVQERTKQFGANVLKAKQESTRLGLFLHQFRSPLVLILIFAAIVSAFVGEWIDATIVIVIIIGSATLSFIQEYNATTAVEKLSARVKVKTQVLRNGTTQAVPAEEIVPGDIVMLSAGSLIPADGILLEAKDFFVNQAVLTGEPFPVEKQPGLIAEQASLADRANCVFMGTNVRSGTAKALVVQIGTGTAFGQIAQRLSLRPPETEFERGVRHFGYLLTQVMLVLVIIVFAANTLAQKSPIESLLFSIALAVGIAPELLPAIVAISLSQGAQHMASRGVIVRQLNAIENLGSMDILCTDKTGTLTEGVVKLEGAVAVQGKPSETVLLHATLNAQFQTGLVNPLDEAILNQARQIGIDTDTFLKVNEIPYDFIRKRLSVVTRDSLGTSLLITKGALDNVLSVCAQVLDEGVTKPMNQVQQNDIRQRYAAWSSEGFRVLGVAVRAVPDNTTFTTADEADMTFVGFLLFSDPPKADVQKTIADLATLGVQLKIITGDNYWVAKHLASEIGMKVDGILTGSELNNLRDEALWHVVDRTTLFAEVDPNQKERILLALHKTGHVVGYMGDGINDAPALYAADVGISVDTAVDVAKESADFVLLEHSLDTLRQGIKEGRATFANTLKYVSYTTSANFGNMFSMAGASLFLPFLPLLATQILLNNFLSDIPTMTIANDNVDPELVEMPHRWDIRFIRNFMILFGLISSVFDYLTFGMLLFVIRSTPEQFRTGWFIESLITELVITLIVRTRRPFFRSNPGKLLWMSTLVVAVIAFLIPYLPFSKLLGFTPLPLSVMLLIVVITCLYIVATELAKHFFYQRHPAFVQAVNRLT